MTFDADERKFKQILLNLLSNAVKFTPEGGRITVARKSGAWRIRDLSVSDTGIGIAAEDREAVFEEFRQVGRVATRRPKARVSALPWLGNLSRCTAAGSE